MAKTLLEKNINGNIFSITTVENSNGHLMYRFEINHVISWYFQAYVYEADGVTSREIPAPFGLSEGKYEEAFQILRSYFNVT